MQVKEVFNRVMAVSDSEIANEFASFGYQLTNAELLSFTDLRKRYRTATNRFIITLLLWGLFGISITLGKWNLDPSIRFAIVLILGLGLWFSLKDLNKKDKLIRALLEDIIRARNIF